MSHRDGSDRVYPVTTSPEPGSPHVKRVYFNGVFTGRILSHSGQPAVYDCAGNLRQGDEFERLVLAHAHDFSIQLALPVKMAGAVTGWSVWRECRWCGRRIPADDLAEVPR